MNLKIKFELEETELNGEIENLIPSSSGVSLPSGGTTGQVLTKNSDADGDAGWTDISGYLSEKLDKNQGVANSGKFLGIGADGIVVPTEFGGGSKNYRKIAEVTISEEIRNIVINKDMNGNPFEITEYLIYGTNVKATGAAQICTSFNTTSTYYAGWTGINGFMDATTAKNIYMESIWIGRRILRLSSTKWGNEILSTMYKPNNDQNGNVEKISCINLIANVNAFSQGTITVWGG